MDLSPLIAELLITNDCVIVPDFGGFIANYQTSGYNEKGDEFSPPSKEVIFSSKLKKNDGLLVNYVLEKEGVGYLDARKIVAEFVSETIFRLENGETIKFDQVGTIRLDQQDNYTFEADQLINLRADAFGLESFHYPQLAAKNHQAPKMVFKDKDPEPQQRKYPALKYIVVGLPILLLLYFIPYNKVLKKGDTYVQPISNSASLSVSDSPVVPLPQASQISAPTELKNDPSLAEDNAVTSVIPETNAIPVKAEATRPEQIQNHQSSVSSSGKFHLVGGCFKVKENADNLAKKLVTQGYPAEVSRHGREFYKVTVQSFETRSEAEEGLSKILDSDPDTDYWLKIDK